MISPRNRVNRQSLAADRDRALALVPVSRETLDRLDRLADLIIAWQPKLNLVAAGSLPELWTRHIADSLQLVPLAPEARIWVDLGSGAGFPGLVVGCALADAPGARVHLVESNGKKAAFLRAAVRATGAAALVHHARIEDFVTRFDSRPDVVTARALAPLEALLRLAYPLLKRGGHGLFPKGQDVEAELTQAAKYWNIEASLMPSRTSPQGRIVSVRGLTPRTRAPKTRENSDD